MRNALILGTLNGYRLRALPVFSFMHSHFSPISLFPVARRGVIRAVAALAALALVSAPGAQPADTPPAPDPASEQPAPEAAAPAAAAPADTATRELEEVRALAQSGAASLALHIMDRIQVGLVSEPERWMRWERERIAIYRQRRDWQALVRRLALLPDGLPLEFQRWADTQRAQGYLELGDGASARRMLQSAIWSGPGDPGNWLPHWRKLVIHSYLVEGLAEDADTAALRYRQDYGDGGMEELLLRARIQLMNDRPAEAARLLAPHAKDPQAAMLYLLAQLRSDARAPRRVVQAAFRQMGGDWVDDPLRAQLWAVVAEAARRSGDRATAANALEHVLVNRKDHPLPEGVFAFDADSLWDAYLDYALDLGNRAQFLIGQDAQWFEAAQKTASKTPVRARSLYAFVVLRGEQAGYRERAVAELVRSLLTRERGGDLIQLLFLESRRFPAPTDIPEAGRHALVDLALAGSNIELASALMATMQQPPAGVDAFMWQLRRARILVLGGNGPKGAEVLTGLLDAHEEMEKVQFDRLLQVVFDLQSAGEHQAAFTLLEALYDRSADEKVQRELLYWMADSQAAEKHYGEAARLYLRSAMLPGPDTMDPWAQSARYQAAENLALAGLTQDARVLYEQLLKATEDATRQAVLRRKLQRLGLTPAPAPG